jgi:hypothetical protein
MSGPNVPYALPSGLFGHGYVDDHQITPSLGLAPARRPRAHPIAGFPQPLLEQCAGEVVFLVYTYVHSNLAAANSWGYSCLREAR